LAVASDEGARGEIGRPVLLRGVVRLLVEQNGERDAISLREALAVAAGVLRDAPDLRARRSELLVEPLEKWERVLAGGAGNLEERRQHRPAFERVLQGVRLAVHARQLKSR